MISINFFTNYFHWFSRIIHYKCTAQYFNESFIKHLISSRSKILKCTVAIIVFIPTGVYISEKEFETILTIYLQAKNLTGLVVCENPKVALTKLYRRILLVLAKAPEHSVYRKNTENIVKKRSYIVNSVSWFFFQLLK